MQTQITPTKEDKAKAKRAETQRKYRENNKAKLNANKRAKHFANREENLKKNKILVECSLCKKQVQKNGIARHQRSATCKRIADMIANVDKPE